MGEEGREREGERERDKEFSSSGMLPKCPVVRVGLASKPGIRNSIQFFHMSGRSPITRPSPLPPRVCITRKLESRVGAGYSTEALC